MIAEIIPRIRSLRKLEVLDYSIPAGMQVEPGMTVEIPFRSQSIFGVIVKIKTSSTILKLRPILHIANASLHLSPIQLELVYHVADSTKTALSIALRTVLHDTVLLSKNQSIHQGEQIPEKAVSTPIRSNRLPALRKVVQRALHGRTPAVIRYAQKDELVGVISLLLQQPGQHLLVMPDEAALAWWKSRLSHLHPIIFSAALPKINQRSIHHQLKTGQPGVFMGTRSAVFLPPDHLNSILVIDEEQESFHQEQNPHYDGREIAVWLAKKLHIPCIFFSQAPRISTAYHFPVIELTQPLTYQPQVINLQDWWSQGGKGMLCPDFLEFISNHLPCVVLYNKKGDYKWYRCTDCGTHQPYASMTTCPNCGSVKLKAWGLGNKKIQVILEQHFPQLRVARADAETVPDPGWDVLLTTTHRFSTIITPQVKGLAIISLDHQLNIPDFRSSERVYALLSRAVYTGVPLCVQSTSPHHPAITYALNQNYALFYEQELASRKKFFYPPFGVVVKLIDRNKKTTQIKKIPSTQQIPELPDHILLDILQ